MLQFGVRSYNIFLLTNRSECSKTTQKSQRDFKAHALKMAEILMIVFCTIKEHVVFRVYFCLRLTILQVANLLINNQQQEL
jgi:hypothetical protein